MSFDVVNILLAYLCVLMGAGGFFFFLHWFTEWRSPWKLSEESLLQCEECHRAFIVRRRSTDARCPRCGKLCHLKRKK